MTDRFAVSHPLYPLVSIAAALFTLIGALAMARSVSGILFLLAVYLLLCLFGYAKTCLSVLPFLIVYLAIFSLIFYAASGGNQVFVLQMVIRLGGVVIAVIPGLTLEPIRLTRCLTALRCPRLVTLGMLITLSFIPVLNAEIRQVRSAMRTRGVISALHPTLFYRAFLIPLIVRLVNISDTLALSVETRGFVSEDANYTVYHPVSFQVRDGIFAVLFLLLLIIGILCSVMEVLPL